MSPYYHWWGKRKIDLGSSKAGTFLVSQFIFLVILALYPVGGYRRQIPNFIFLGCFYMFFLFTTKASLNTLYSELRVRMYCYSIHVKDFFNIKWQFMVSTFVKVVIASVSHYTNVVISNEPYSNLWKDFVFIKIKIDYNLSYYIIWMFRQFFPPWECIRLNGGTCIVFKNIFNNIV